MTGKAIDPSSLFVLPEFSSTLSRELRRPEIDLLDLGMNRLDAVVATVESQRKPRAFGLATLGYGNPPGNNFLRDEFAPYYVVGAGLKWNIFGWNRTRNEKEILAVQKTILEDRKKDLSDNLKRLLDAVKAEIDGLNSLLATDIDLIALRERITAAAGSQYQNGTITATEYLIEMNAENQALLNHEIHKINLSLAMVRFMNISGQEIP
jgi:outer membrane protein TolC